MLVMTTYGPVGVGVEGTTVCVGVSVGADVSDMTGTTGSVAALVLVKTGSVSVGVAAC